MKRLLAAAFLAALSLVTSTPAHAESAPNLLGLRGVLLTPNADPGAGTAIGANAFFFDRYNTYGVHGTVAGRLELSGTFLDPESGRFGGDTEFLVNAKFAILKENIALPGFSVGVVDAFDSLDGDPNWFLVAGKSLPKILPVVGGLRLNVGYGGGALFNDRIFANAELRLGTPLDILPVEHPSFSIMFEWINRDINLGLRSQFRGFTAQVGLFDWDDFGGGISYTHKLR